jgi:hypothetical protein
MARMQSSKFEVEKFSGKNSFALWKIKMQGSACATRIAKGIGWKVKETRKHDIRGLGGSGCKIPQYYSFVSADEVLFNIVEEETTTGLWTKLESLYMTKNLSNKIFLKRQLYNLRMKEGMKITDHLNVFNTLICHLTAMEVKFEDEDKTVTLLCSLPESWDHLVTTMWFSTTYTIDYDTIVGALLSEEMRRRSSKETSTAEAMLVRGRSTEGGQDKKGTTRSKSKDSKGKEKCWFCGKSGHLKKD